MARIVTAWPYALFLAAMAIPVFHLVPLGIPGEFEYRAASEPPWDILGILFIAIPITGIAGTLYLALVKTPVQRRRDIGVCLTLLVLCSFLLHIACAVALSPYGIAEALYHLMQEYGDGAYMLQAYEIRDFTRYFGALEHELAHADIARFPHPSVHPPGFTLFFHLLHRMMEWEVPGTLHLRSWVWDNSPMLREMFPHLSFDLSRVLPYTGAACLAAVFLWGMAALLPVPTYFLARLFLGPRASILAAATTTLYPGTHLFNPSTDQVLPLVATIAVALGLAAILKRRLSLALAFGICLGLALQFSLALGVCAVLFLLFAAGHARLCRQAPETPGGSSGPAMPSVTAIVLRAGTGLALVCAFFFAFDLNLPRVFWLCLVNNHKFNLMVQRSYWPWLLLQPMETAYSLGLPMLGLLAAVAAAQVGRWRMASAGPGDLFVRAMLLTLILLSVSGVNRGEVGRLWLFLYPALSVACCVGMGGARGEGSVDELPESLPLPGLAGTPLWARWSVLLAGQAVQMVLLRLSVDAMSSAGSLSGLV
ncbi:MAG: hypothetical protein HYU36_22895 [Planctomycetes bacterium]|nr:hypothetical protein [Planctomycetota bacterium]